jgi:predicted RNase H-like nuclease
VVKRYRDWIRVDSLEDAVGFDRTEYEAIENPYKRSCDVVTADDPLSAKAETVPTATDLKNDIAALKAIVETIENRRKTAKTSTQRNACITVGCCVRRKCRRRAATFGGRRQTPMVVVAGIDGCPAGWLCLTKDLCTGAVQARILTSISDLLGLAPGPELVMVDVPIGLTAAGPRKCDLEARALLKAPRASSVFPAPIRPTLVATSYTQACQIGEGADGRKLSQQAWGILPKIREVDTFLRTDPTLNQWVREVHPEVCFWAWNGGRAMAHRKKSSAGRAEREALVKPVYGASYIAAQSILPRGQYGNDDLLDAFAALWTGERVVAGKELVIPAKRIVDSCGLRMEMVA